MRRFAPGILATGPAICSAVFSHLLLVRGGRGLSYIGRWGAASAMNLRASTLSESGPVRQGPSIDKFRNLLFPWYWPLLSLKPVQILQLAGTLCCCSCCGRSAAVFVSEIGPGFSPDIKAAKKMGFSPWDMLFVPIPLR
jgi:hypothetical protein